MPTDDPACIDARTALLARIDALDLPDNFLDALIDELGGVGAVAEMTGRKGCAHLCVWHGKTRGTSPF